MNWTIFFVLILGMALGAVMTLCWIEWLTVTHENRKRLEDMEPGAHLDDTPYRPLDAQHPLVRQDAERRKTMHARIRRELDAMDKRGKT